MAALIVVATKEASGISSVTSHWNPFVNTCNRTLTISKQNSTTFSTYQENIPIIRHGRIQRGEQGVRTHPPLENHKDIGFLSNTGPDPQKKTHKATKQAFNFGPLGLSARI